MTLSLKHAFTSAKGDGTDPTEVQPSNWNAEHTITAAANSLIGNPNGTAGAASDGITCTAAGRALIDDADAAAQRTTLGLGAVSCSGSVTTFTGNVIISANGYNVTGNCTITGTLGLSSDFAINTNKFTVTASSGNTSVAGTLGVTGNATFTADVSAATVSGAQVATQAQQETASATNLIVTPGRQQFHPSAAKCWGLTTGGGTPVLSSNYNITSITDTAVGRLTVTIGTDFSIATWALFGMALSGTGALRAVQSSTTNTGTCELDCLNGASTLSDPDSGYFFLGFGDQ